MGNEYRPEIDGLRAIAVTAVVLYHAGLGGAGFVGVDVFFVISGYLITRLLLAEERIDLAGFYARRARRILPAVTVVIACVMVASPILLTPEDAARSLESAASSSIFSANIYFQLTTGGYFDRAVEQMPLLHLWSLAVEEQFYFLWPALLVVVPRRQLAVTLAGLGVVSLLFSEWLVSSYPQAAFYQMPARFWELAVGGIIAASSIRQLPDGAIPAGLFCLILSISIESGHFPGVGAIPAVLSSCLIIAAIHGGAKNRLLSSRLFVGVGLISYSLYLWHWPLLAFYRASSVGGGDLLIRIFLCYLAVALAFLSYRYIEQPFRKLRWSDSRTVFQGAATSIALTLSALLLAENIPQPPPRGDEALARRAELDKPVQLPDEAGATIAVWGDSYAVAWQQLATRIGTRENRSLKTVSQGGCPPLIGFKIRSPEHAECIAHNSETIGQMQQMDTVILAFHWQRYSGDQRALKLESSLRDTLSELSGVRRVIIIGPTPVLRDELPKCIRLGVDCSVSRIGFEMETRPIRSILTEISKTYPNVRVVDATGYLCSSTLCPGIKGGVPLYTDKSHLTATASRGILDWLNE